MLEQQQKNNSDNLHKEHRKRLRNRYVNAGIESFAEHEILEMLLFYVIPRRDTNPLAHKLINEFGSLQNVLNSSCQDLITIDGIGPATADFLTFIGDVIQFCTCNNYARFSLKNKEKRYSYFLNELQYEMRKEILMVACMDNSMCVRKCSKLNAGEPGTVHFDIQSLTNMILESRCTNVILAHNHPNGEAVPSYEDIQSTKYIKKTLKALGITLIDHIIIGNKQAYSMAEQNRI